MAKVRVLIVDDIEETRENIKRLLLFEQEISVVGEAANGEEALQQAEKFRPDIVLMDINMPVLDGISATELISLRVPDSQIIIMSVQGEQEYLKKAMIAGAREYIIKPFSSDELIDAIRRVFEFGRKRKVQEKVTQVLTEAAKAPQIISVFSTKGGVGRTVLAANLAVALAKEQGKRVALVDLDLQFGDVAVMLNITPKKTLTELVQEINHLDADLMETYLVDHSSGIKVLPAPSRPEYAELIKGSHVEKFLRILKQYYDYIVVDTPPLFNETNLAALDLSDQIILPISLDLPTVKNVKLSLEVLGSLHIKGKVKMVLNRSAQDVGIKSQDVEKSLDFLISAHIPSDGRIVVTSVNKGVPFVVSHPGTKVAKAIEELAEMVRLNEGTQEKLTVEAQKKGLLVKLFNF